MGTLTDTAGQLTRPSMTAVVEVVHLQCQLPPAGI